MAKTSWKLCSYGPNNAKGRAGVAIDGAVHDAATASRRVTPVAVTLEQA